MDHQQRRENHRPREDRPAFARPDPENHERDGQQPDDGFVAHLGQQQGRKTEGRERGGIAFLDEPGGEQHRDQDHHEVEQFKAAARGVVGEQRQAGEQGDPQPTRHPPGEKPPCPVDQSEKNEGERAIQDERVGGPVSGQVVQERREKRKKQRAFVHHAIEDHERTLDVAAPHRREHGLVQVHAHRGAEKHNFVHHDLEPERLVHDQHRAPGPDHAHRNPVDPAPPQRTDVVAARLPERLQKKHKSEQHEPKARVGDKHDRRIVRDCDEPQHDRQRDRQQQQPNPPIVYEWGQGRAIHAGTGGLRVRWKMKSLLAKSIGKKRAARLWRTAPKIRWTGPVKERR